MTYRLSLVVAASVTFGFLLGFAGVGVAYWVEGPSSPAHREYSSTQEYDNPTCPPKHEPRFKGILLFQGQSHPIYDCVFNGEPEERVRWESFEGESPTPEPG